MAVGRKFRSIRAMNGRYPPGATEVLIYRQTLSRLTCRVRRYEQFMHLLALYASVAGDEVRVRELIENAVRWSNSHYGHDDFCPKEREEFVDAAFKRLLVLKPSRPVT